MSDSAYCKDDFTVHLSQKSGGTREFVAESHARYAQAQQSDPCVGLASGWGSTSLDGFSDGNGGFR
jgi:hypothetical protein